MNHRTLSAFLMFPLLSCLSTTHAADLVPDLANSPQWQPLFDGKSLTNWHIIGHGQWTIENGAIVGRHEAASNEFGHLVSDKIYSNFLIRLKYKAVKGNSGLYFRVEKKGFSGVSGFQAEIADVNDVGGLYETNGRAWVVQPKPEDVKKWHKINEWNDMIVAALGSNVTVYVNGQKSSEIVNDPGRLQGHFALQVHGGQDCEVMFKDIQILSFTNLLSAEAAAPQSLPGFKAPTGDWQQVADVSKDTNNERALTSKPGAGTIVNGPKGTTTNIFSQLTHGDVAAHVEFLIPKGSNSGVYFQSRYEIQVYDSFGVEKDQYPGIECGGIYERWRDDKGFEGRSPRVNASLPPGQWQRFDVLFRAPRFDASGKKTANACFVKVIHNGQVVHENVELTGPTRAAASETEAALGALMLQGDHGPVAYRHLCLLPLGN